MNVIARKALQVFWKRYPQAEARRGEWSGPADLKRAFGNNVDFVGDNRAIFDIGGNKYRLVVHFSYKFKTALIKFVGTHEEYDRIDAETV